MGIRFSDHAALRLQERFGIKVPAHHWFEPRSYRRTPHFHMDNGNPGYSIVMEVRGNLAVLIVDSRDSYVLTVIGPERSPAFDAAVGRSKKIK
jgi:hypothetical protein